MFGRNQDGAKLQVKGAKITQGEYNPVYSIFHIAQNMETHRILSNVMYYRNL